MTFVLLVANSFAVPSQQTTIFFMPEYPLGGEQLGCPKPQPINSHRLLAPLREPLVHLIPAVAKIARLRN
jgi:hypothetical protein